MSVFSLKIDIADNKFFNGETSPLFSQSQAKLARQFHQKIAGYRPTPLCALDDLANLFGVKKILVKDESKRFGLNAFKMLGGAYAIAQLLCEKYHLDIETLSFEHLKNAIGEKIDFRDHHRRQPRARCGVGSTATRTECGDLHAERFCSGTR